MAARLRVFLTREQDKTLLNLRTADVPQKVKDARRGNQIKRTWLVRRKNSCSL